MYLRFISMMSLLLSLVLVACSSDNRVPDGQFAFLDSLDITINDDLLLGDSLTMPDIYCGDPEQQASDLKGMQLDKRQYQALIKPVGGDIPDPMSNWLLLGVRDMGGDITLAAYYACNGVGYCVDLVTYDHNGHVLDAINTREMHLIWRVDLSDSENDNSYTLDSFITFDGPDHLTLHRVMGRCLMNYEDDLKAKPQWQQAWDQTYTIDAKGQFILHGQQVVKEQGLVDHYATMDFKSWDLLVCSLHDPGVMDVWNAFAPQVGETYAADYEHNPFPWDVTQLYQMNPQRFLRWMALKRDQGNHLLPYFRLPVERSSALLQEIARLDDPAARQWLTALVNSWDSPHQATPPVN